MYGQKKSKEQLAKIDQFTKPEQNDKGLLTYIKLKVKKIQKVRIKLFFSENSLSKPYKCNTE